MVIINDIRSIVNPKRAYALTGDIISVFGGDGGSVLFCLNQRTGEKFPVLKSSLEPAESVVEVKNS